MIYRVLKENKVKKALVKHKDYKDKSKAIKSAEKIGRNRKTKVVALPKEISIGLHLYIKDDLLGQYGIRADSDGYYATIIDETKSLYCAVPLEDKDDITSHSFKKIDYIYFIKDDFKELFVDTFDAEKGKDI